MATPRTAGGPHAAHFADIFERVVANVGLVIQGKEEVARRALVCIAAGGHLLIEDVPGVGKTSLAKALARSFGLGWRRIQFTPDLLPSDVTGASVYDRHSGQFSFRPGGVFTNVVLGDEINRASPKTQSALLEAMEERQVTVESTTYALPDPFLVIATQNPADHAGTYPLPESQLDRFLMRLHVGYPDRTAELAMLSRGSRHGAEDLGAVVEPEAVSVMVATAERVEMSGPLAGYVVDLAAATRRHPGLVVGVSPRATLSLQQAARASAAADGRDYVVPDDVKDLLVPVLAHRLALSTEAAIRGASVVDLLDEAVRSVPVPTGRR